MSSKKTLLSKLKKDLNKSKAKISVDVAGTISATERRNSFLKEIKIMFKENKTLQDVRDRVRIHISFYNDDKEFSKLLDLEQKDLEIFLESYDDKTNIMTQIEVFYKNIFSKTQKSEVEMLKDRLRSVVLPIDKIILYSFEPYVFDAVQFTPDYNIMLFPSLIHDLLNDLNLNTLVEMRKKVHKFMYEHRYDYMIRYLENDSYSDQEKQYMVSDTIKTEYENIRSFQLYLQIMNLIDEKITPFQKPLQSLLLRYLPDKEYFLQTKNFLDIILEIVINKPSDKQLAKYFPNKKKLDHFRKTFLPLLQNQKEYSKLIHNRIQQEFEQPFVFKNAERVKWQTYLEIVKKHLSTASTSSIEMDIYDALNKNDSTVLDQLIILLNDENINKSQIQILLTKYITTQPISKQKNLGKLKNISSNSKLKELLVEIKKNGYIDVLNTLSTTMPKKKIPLMKAPPLLIMDKDDTETLYKYRFDISNFDHTVLEPIDDISVYVSGNEKSSDKFFIPNDFYYKHLADDKIVKTQKGHVFTMNKLKMKVVYVTLTNDYIYQDEDSYTRGLVFVKTQKGLELATDPLSFYSYFTSCPILNHQSSLMMILRQKTTSRLSTTLIKEVSEKHGNMSSLIEESIYKYSETIDQYTTSISTFITLVQLTYTKSLKNLLLTRSINMSNIGQLLKEPIDTIFQVFYPELFAVNDEKSLRMLFDNNQHEMKRRIILDTYFIQNPMRRIPYIPIGRYVGGDLDKIEIIKDIPTIPEDLIDRYLQEPTEEEEEIPIITKELEEEVITEELDPLADFIQTAFDELDNL